MASDGTLQAFLEAHSTRRPRLDDYLLQTKPQKLDSSNISMKVAPPRWEKKENRGSKKKKSGSHRYKSPNSNVPPLTRSNNRTKKQSRKSCDDDKRNKENIDILIQHQRTLQLREYRKQSRRPFQSLTQPQEPRQEQQQSMIMTSSDESIKITKHNNTDIHLHEEDAPSCEKLDEKSNLLSSMMSSVDLQDDVLFMVNDWDPFDTSIEEHSSFGSFLVVSSQSSSSSSCFLTPEWSKYRDTVFCVRDVSWETLLPRSKEEAFRIAWRRLQIRLLCGRTTDRCIEILHLWQIGKLRIDKHS